MAAPENRFKNAITTGQLQIGLWQSLGSATTAELCAQCGFDWLLIDGEHGPNDLRSIRDQLQVITPSPAQAVVRIPGVDVVWVKQVMDAGAQTVLVPLVNTAEDAALMAAAMRYPPQGIRGNGAGVVRASNYGMDDDYLHTANDQACLLVQVETVQALENLDAICATDGVDGVFIGPADLATSLGHHGDPLHSDVQNTIEDTITRIKASGKAPGILMGNEERIERYRELGALFIAVGSDVGLLTGAARALATRWRG